MVWTDQATGKSFSVSGNDKAAYAQAAAKIQSQINQGHPVDKSGLEILRKAEYIGVKPL
ncbi:hypothetical protein IKF40_02580 [Candidatus Saccharibacteria bacterium]|nr:hypothetical protein [Candidatus Saccharibacteria bacterium]MBR2989787.1 hypothetical protein [Candidatus Saccharibacteria bacterium]